MRVLLDATSVPARRGGVGRYVDELLHALDAASVEVVVAAQAADADHLRQVAPHARVVAAPRLARHRAVRLMWEQLALPLLVRRVRADVVHSPHYTLPLLARQPVVVTVHDATFFSSPELHLRVKAVFFRWASHLAARRAAAIVVPSVATRDEFVRYTHAEVSRVIVAYHGVDLDRFHPVDEGEQARVRSTLDIGTAPYVAFLGTIEPRKNVPALVRAWVRVSRGEATPAALVLAGERGWDDEVESAVAQVPAPLIVRRPGYLPLDDLPGFLAGADVVVYPSLGEGFGLPVLEAMACGATVLTSRELSLPEVGGDAVAYAGTSADDIATALAALLADPRRRASLSAAAADRAGTFTWARSAQQHLAAYAAVSRMPVGALELDS